MATNYIYILNNYSVFMELLVHRTLGLKAYWFVLSYKIIR